MTIKSPLNKSICTEWLENDSQIGNIVCGTEKVTEFNNKARIIKRKNWRIATMKKRNNVYLLILLIVVIIFAIVGIPIIINELYTGNNGYLTKWGAKDVLAYYGSVLAFIGTVLLGALSLYQNNVFKKSNEKREKLMIKPYIFTSIEYENATYLTKEKKEYTLIEYSNSGGEFHVKHSSRNTHSAISDYERKEKEYSDFLKLPKDKQDYSKQIRLLEEQTNILNCLNKRFLLVIYDVTNAGHGNAINIDITLNKNKITPLFCLSQNQSKELIFLFDFQNAKHNKEYTFNIEFCFYDIECDIHYHQEETFYINKDSESNLSLRFKEQISKPHNKEKI